MIDGARIFLRDDDVGAPTDALRAFVEIFAAQRLPVSYQVIPQALTPECAEFLQAEHKKAPELFEFGQHGLSHEMMVNGRREFYEFGPERGYDEQLQVILAGREILRQQLGEAFGGEVFTPPRHRYDRNTLKALRAAGVTILSASSYPDLRHRVAYRLGRAMGLSNLGRPGVPYHGAVRPDCGLFELSISVPVDDGVRTGASAADVMEMIAKASRTTSTIGLMFHHHAYASAADQAFLRELAGRLTATPNVSFHRLSELRDLLTKRAN
jgi:predicted deacetylase